MKKVFEVTAKTIGIILLILIVINSIVRVSDSSGTIGIVEEKLWGHSIWDFTKPEHSENYNRWKLASDASDKVANLLQEYGISELTINNELEAQRKQATELSSLAFKNASSIPKDYLKESNSELPEMYFNYLVTALDYWEKGFSGQDTILVNQGVNKYNDFLTWMHSKSREDFKDLH